jgi:hypothetical protein
VLPCSEPDRPTSNRLVVYTAIFGEYDALHEPPAGLEGVDFICFTNQKNVESTHWDVRHVGSPDLTNHMMNRRYKLLPHLYLGDYEKSLYVDANVLVIGDPRPLFEKYLADHDMAVPKHPLRNCIYEEALACLRTGKSGFTETAAQMKQYKREGFPVEFGLAENNVILRNHNRENMIDLMNRWWNELNSQAQRDQLSLGYVLWTEGLAFNFMSENARNDSGFFKYQSHRPAFKFKKFVRKRENRFIVKLKRLLRQEVFS